jgi:hypothetical protein
MHRAAPAQHPDRSHATHRPGPRRAWPSAPAPATTGPGRAWLAAILPVLLLALLLACASAPARAAEHAELTTFEVTRDEDGVFISYAVDLELSRSVEDALLKGVPLYFVAEAQIFRDRWYWRDRRVADAVRLWRVVYQPLTSSYRVTFGGLSQTYATRAEALAAISRASRWRIAEPGQIEEGSSHYVEFGFRLDTTLLPRPMQIGVAGQPDWQIGIKRTVRLN